MITEETIARVKSSLQATKSFSALEVIEELEKQIENYKMSENESVEIIAELKAQVDKMKCCENSTTTLNGEFVSCCLQQEKAELERDKEYLDKVNNEQTEVILKLNEQIEKMKCCENCKKIETCKLFAHIDINVCDKWELEE